MDVDQTAVMQLLLSVEKSQSELKQALTEPGQRYSGEAQASYRMRARVEAVTSGLETKPLTDTEQVVGNTGTTQWRWQIKAVGVGPQRIEVTLTAIAEVRQKESSLLVDTYKQTIIVNVTRSYRMKQLLGSLRENWPVLAGIVAAVSAIVGWAITRRRQSNRHGAGF
jgi:predicted secreted protein